MELEYTKIRVVDFDLKELVVLPREIDLNEWLASNSAYPGVRAVRPKGSERCWVWTHTALTAVVVPCFLQFVTLAQMYLFWCVFKHD